ncbi:DUF2059 domain-containing protein [Hyphococcus luteus]|uniref:DUF2059 domain-containing protein n=1 Tax=Hyphococcus luteus TaxID=2058213 RepID=A0A2S7KB06_9PROT|nr:DUF2059 domain-containing protein [Marinicaulis flavus]PQA89638.1 hypothetical protein CW354_01880 [Marinicaulis flavus]
MTFRNITLAAAASVGLCAPALAADDSAEKMKLAEELVELSQAKQMSKQIIAQMAPAQIQVIKSMTPETDLSDAQLEAILTETSAIMREELEPAIDGLIDDMTPVYAEVYTVEELQGVVDFYKSPVGASFLSKQSLAIEKSMAVSMQWAQNVIPGVMARAMPRIQEKVKQMKEAQ